MRWWALALGATVAMHAMAQVPAPAASPAPPPAAAPATPAAVYRCPGPPVLYTDALTPQEARERGCRLIEGVPISIVPSTRPAAAAGPARGGPSGASGAAAMPPAGARPAMPEARIDPNAQRQRDRDARRILEDELKREEEKLAALKREFNNGEPERRGDERNFQNYLDRVASMRASITRSEADVAAIKRELAKLPS